jgi:short-subunit dehydrogenase
MSDPEKYALVTGASSGIGWHFAKELAARGYGIVAVSNQGDLLADLRTEVETLFRVTVRTLDLDLSRSDAAATVFDFCRQHNLQVEVLVNNAGMMIYGELVEREIAKVNSILNLHMQTPVLLSRLFGKLMLENQKGYILNVSSISAVMPYPTISLYGPTKTFLRKFSRALRHELRGSGIFVTCLIPGATFTALFDSEHINVPLAMRLGIMKKPDDVARTGVRALFNNRPIRIPGTINKFVVYFFPLIPSCLIGWIYKRVKMREKQRSLKEKQSK